MLLAGMPAWADDPITALVTAMPPGARETARSTDAVGSFGLPVGPAGPAMAPPMHRQDGQRQRIAWVWPHDTADQVTAQAAEAWADAGFDTLYTCRTDACGGFDFRLVLPVLPIPDMAVNLADFSYVVGLRRSPPALVALLVSTMEGRSHAQLTLITPASEVPPVDSAAVAGTVPDDGVQPAGDLAGIAAHLDRDGRVVLDGVDFAPGSTTLGPDARDALSDLAAWLAIDPARRVVLVGHTDWTGTPEANLVVSRARAAAVGAALESLGADPAQITVAGVGPFAPRAENTTPEGRASNRRVEAIRLPAAP